MVIIYRSKNFNVISVDKPLISREEGGHLIISPKVQLVDRNQLSSEKAVELMRLTMLVGKAFTLALKKRGIKIGRINYQDNGNWGCHLHIHLFGRAKTAKVEKWGEPVYLPRRKTGFYKDFKTLNKSDIKEIQKQIKILLKTQKYDKTLWSLKK